MTLVVIYSFLVFVVANSVVKRVFHYFQTCILLVAQKLLEILQLVL